jgi:glutathione peroxidase
MNTVVLLLLSLFSYVSCASGENFFDLFAETHTGQTVPFKQFEGQVVLVVNVASECGYTSSGYTAMTKLHKKYHKEGLTILAFPCNQFGAQEPGTGDEILNFAQTQFQADFHILKKVDVNGPRSHQVFKFLKQYFPGDVAWNFHGIVSFHCSKPFCDNSLISVVVG